MKKRRFLYICMILLLLCGLLGCTNHEKPADEEVVEENTIDTEEVVEQDDKDENDTSITCMSFNVQGINTQDYLPAAIRAPYIAEYIKNVGVELAGLQEAGSHTYDWTGRFFELVCEDGQYGAIKIGDEPVFQDTTQREDGRVSNSAGLMILYRTDRFELLDHGAQRYTSTESQERYFQWAKLRDVKTDKTVFVTNTHWSIDWDENGKLSVSAGIEHRTKQANELRAFWENVVGDNVLFATGDYNCNQISDWLIYLGKGIYKEGNEAYGWKGTPDLHIDNIFINTEQMDVADYYMSEDRLMMEGVAYRFSDHEPVILKATYKTN